MRVSIPLMLITTPIGIGIGLFEGYRLAGGLVVLMLAMLGVLSVGIATVVSTIRREQQAEREHARTRQTRSPPQTPIREVS